LPEGYYGMSGPDSIHLGKSAFMNEEQLGRTLVHEREHLRQRRRGVFVNAIDAMTQQVLDSEAYRAEDDWAEFRLFFDQTFLLKSLHGVLGDGGEELNIDVYGITKKSNQTANRNHK
jgi:hypothetical protein